MDAFAWRSVQGRETINLAVRKGKAKFGGDPLREQFSAIDYFVNNAVFERLFDGENVFGARRHRKPRFRETSPAAPKVGIGIFDFFCEIGRGIAGDFDAVDDDDRFSEGVPLSRSCGEEDRATRVAFGEGISVHR